MQIPQGVSPACALFFTAQLLIADEPWLFVRTEERLCRIQEPPR